MVTKQVKILDEVDIRHIIAEYFDTNVIAVSLSTKQISKGYSTDEQMVTVIECKVENTIRESIDEKNNID